MPHTIVTPEREIAFKLRYQTENGSYELTIVLPHGYPNVCPRVYADPVDLEAPHLFPDGTLCIFGVMTSWNPAKHTVNLAIEYARRWLSHYEIWQLTGDWPKPGI